jgi:transposase
MISAVRKGRSFREVARAFQVHPKTVARWVRRAGEERLNRLDLSDRSHRPIAVTRTAVRIEDAVLEVRDALKRSPLGEYGPAAIHRELVERGFGSTPSVVTIWRILERRGALDGRRRVRRPAPPKGWYLPDVAQGNSDIDSFDIIEDMSIEAGPTVDILTATSILGRLPGAWPTEAQITARFTLEAILEHWRSHGLPAYAQFDNDTRFQGAHHHKDAISRVVRLCLSLGVIPVFAPPRESGFQASIENFNGRWEDKVWSRFHHESLEALRGRSHDYVAALIKRHAPTIESAPRAPFPANWALDLQRPLTGRIIYLRRTNEEGRVSLLGHNFAVHRNWPHRLVRCEIDLDADKITFFALRRGEPTLHNMLNEVKHHVPRRRFRMRDKIT